MSDVQNVVQTATSPPPEQPPSIFGVFFPDGRPCSTYDALNDPFLDQTLVAVRACAEAVVKNGSYEAILFASNLSSLESSPADGAQQFVKLIDDTVALDESEKKYFTKITLGVYGLWIFNGLRSWLGPAETIWNDFELSAIGSIKKSDKTRKSGVVSCALHPLQVIDRYVFQSL